MRREVKKNKREWNLKREKRRGKKREKEETNKDNKNKKGGS